MKRKWKEFEEWSTRSLKNLAIAESVITILTVISLLLANWIPAKATESALSSARLSIQSANAQLATIESRYTEEQKWFATTYLSGMDEALKNANRLLADQEWVMDDGSKEIGAEKALKYAKHWNPDITLRWARIAEKSASEALSLIAEVAGRMDANLRERETARVNLAQLQTQLVSVTGILSNVELRFSSETGQYLAKYTQPMSEKLSSGEDSKSGASDHITKGQSFLPEDSSHTQAGDPRLAQAELDQAKVAIDEINTMIAQVTSSLDYQREALEQAEPTTSQAGTAVNASWNHLENIRVARNWSYEKALYQAKTLYDQSFASWDEAVETLNSPIPSENGKIDYPKAYEAAKAALGFSTQASQEADRVVQVADYIIANIPVCENEIAQAESRITEAEGAFAGLERDHARSNWSGQDQNLAQARSYRDSASQLLSTSKSQSSIEDQQFDSAKAALDQAIGAARDAQGKAQEVTSRYNDLESYRAQAPGAISSAESAISGARGTVSSLKGYSSRGLSEFSQAESELQAAYNARELQDWPAAVSHSNNAGSMASNAASYCRADATATEERHIEETREAHARETAVAVAATRAAEAAEEAAEAAREAAEAAREASESWSSSDTDSSEGWSSSSSSDNNSWSSGSSSDNNAW